MEHSDTRKRLTAARERLDAKDLAGAVAIYEEILMAGEPRPDVLLTISGDLGSTGHVRPIVELVAPLYDAQRHGPAIGINVLQAYLALRNTEAAQHVLDMLFALGRPELEERLFGFSNAIVEAETENATLGRTTFFTAETVPDPAALAAAGPGPGGVPSVRVSLATISRPIWSYGLEAMTETILPSKEGSHRRIAFAQLAQIGIDNVGAAIARPEDEMGRLTRALPLWLAEGFYFSPLYAPVTALGYLERSDGARQPMIFAAEWMTDNLRQLMDSAKGGLDYVFTGTIRQQAGDFELSLRVWEMKKFRERKRFSARWTPATADEELLKLQAQVHQFMEWAPYPAGTGLAYAPPASPLAWLDMLGASLGLFLVEKNLLPVELMRPPAPSFAAFAPRTAESPMASLAWLTSLARARDLGIAPDPVPAVRLAETPAVAEARAALALEG